MLPILNNQSSTKLRNVVDFNINVSSKVLDRDYRGQNKYGPGHLDSVIIYVYCMKLKQP